MVRYDLVDSAMASVVGAELVQANWEVCGSDVVRYVYRYRPMIVPVGQVAKSLRHYVYQCSEGPGWLHSEARDMCLRLAVALLDQVPGYTEAAWQ